LLFDFFANCEYFEEKFDYDAVLNCQRLTAVIRPLAIETAMSTMKSMLLTDERYQRSC
jgi:hypothetical protein